MRLVWDLETTPAPEGNHTLPDHVWMNSVADADSDQEWWFSDEPEAKDWGADGSMAQGLDLLASATMLIGHNIARFDLPVLEKLHGFELHCPIWDTFNVSMQQYFTTLTGRTFQLRRAAARGLSTRAARDAAEDARIPANYAWKHALESWGYRLRCYKNITPVEHGVEFFEKFSRDMVRYGRQDPRVTRALFHFERTTQSGPKYESRWPVAPMEAMIAESQYAYILAKQERNGVGYDVEGASKLYAELAGERGELLQELRAEVPGWYKPRGKLVVPKKTMASKKHPPGHERYFNREAGCAYQPIEWVDFNPGSGQHIANVLLRRGWEPDSEDGYTDQIGLVAGKLRPVPKTDDETLAELEFDFPIVKQLRRYGTLDKRIGQLAEGDKAFLKKAVAYPDGTHRIHGRVKPTGTRTSRCSHSDPNVNCPKVGKPYGEEMRSHFRPTRAREGWVMVGADASSLEMCCLAQALSHFDGGRFARMLEEGLDTHEAWRQATGLHYRGRQKNLNYALIYGAGDPKLGRMVLLDLQQAFDEGKTEDRPPLRRYARGLGKAARGALLSKVPGLQDLVNAAKKAYKRGYIISLDGRVIACDSEHGAINDILQSYGAAVMKYAKIRFHELVREAGFVEHVDYAYMLDVHDEVQLECRPALGDTLGQMFVDAIAQTGEKFGFVLPLTGEYKVGANWAATH